MKFSRNLSIIVVLISILFSLSCSNRDSESVLVFAAASLGDSLKEITIAYEAEYETEISFSFGGSQKLARQISLGANPDVILSAGVAPIEFLETRGLLTQQRYNILTNELVVVAPSDIQDRIKKLEDLLAKEISRIAIADPDTAPAGIYSIQALSNLKLNQKLSSKIVTGENVRIALTYVERGNAEVGIVYRTDAMLAESLSVLDIIPLDAYDQVLYVAAINKSARNPGGSVDFCEFLLTDKARTIFSDHGFSFP
ncbi:MAG: molybdate transport system substrate-binding protein [Chloroflexi bacterium]|jgi:molybdate transport system substrate-binding protein|nr:MAG: molybdate transport system substrate-binding protein [Chloroflexota bacterium]